MKKKYFLLALSLFLGVILVGCQNEVPTSTEYSGIVAKYDSGNGHGGHGGGGIGCGELSDQEKDGLLHMRLEEKLARDVYTVMGDLWANDVFLTIKVSEQRHMDAIKRLLVKYNVPDPIAVDSLGVFPDPQFQQLFDQYIAQGSISLQEAFLAGKAIEELDIADLTYQLTYVDNQDLIKVYQNLKAASEKHLAAFSINTYGL